MFQVGQHVLCVNAAPNFAIKWALPTASMQGLAAGRVYTVREVAGPYWWHDVLRPPGDLFLEEIARPVPFDSGRFRPLSSDRLSIFRQHLAPIDKVLT